MSGGTPVLKLAATVALVSSSWMAAPAAAEDLTVLDARGDMVKVEEGGSNPQPAPGATVGDVVRSTFRHTEHRVVVRSKMAGLTPTGKRFTMWIDVQTGARRTWTVGVQATRAHRDGRVIFMDTQGRRPMCGVRHHLDYAADVVRVSVPNGCLHHPRVVRFRLLTERVRHDWHYAWLDNGLAVDMEDQRRTSWLGVG